MKKPKLINRDPPDWQSQKLVLARKLVEQNETIISLLKEIKNGLKRVEEIE